MIRTAKHAGRVTLTKGVTGNPPYSLRSYSTAWVRSPARSSHFHPILSNKGCCGSVFQVVDYSRRASESVEHWTLSAPTGLNAGEVRTGHTTATDRIGPAAPEGFLMTTTQPAPNAAPDNVSQTGVPNQYHLQIVAVEGLGTCVTVILHITEDVDSRAATLLIPSVVLGAQTSAPVHTELIRTVHNSTFAGIGHPQRDHYTVMSLTGQASRGPLSL